MPYAQYYRDLDVYKSAQALAQQIFILSKSFPKEERYSLTDQIRRSSRSIGAQIAEAWAKRKYEKHFISKLTDANGELFETQHWVETAASSGYIDAIAAEGLIKQYEVLSKRINSMISKSNIFCF